MRVSIGLLNHIVGLLTAIADTGHACRLTSDRISPVGADEMR
ncbi:MAG: hypothetical protein ACRYF2_14470 [Janthinobacterium lividum]